MIALVVFPFLIAVVCFGGDVKSSRVVGFWNVYAEGPHYKRIVDEQFNMMQRSGLIDKVDWVNYLTSGLEGPQLTFPHEKFKHLVHKEDGNEVDTLTRLYDHCKENTTDKVFYFHNKGSYHHDKRNEGFRFALDCFNLNPHCIPALDEFDTCGFRITPVPHPHYSGNFWWATCQHITKLVPPNSQSTNETFRTATAALVQDGEYGPSCVIKGCCDLGLGRFFSETWVASAPQFRPADCFDAMADATFLYGYNLPSEPINSRCPGHHHGQASFGMECGLASTIISSSKFKEVFKVMRPNPWEEHLQKLVLRSVAWYGELPHTLLEWNTLLTVVNYEQSHSSQLYRDGTLLKASGQRSVYLMQDGKKHAFMSLDAFVNRGFEFGDCDIIDFNELAKIPDGDGLY